MQLVPTAVIVAFKTRPSLMKRMQAIIHRLFHTRQDLGGYRLIPNGCRYYCRACVKWYEVRWKD
jgi:hypothetical protein